MGGSMQPKFTRRVLYTVTGLSEFSVILLVFTVGRHMADSGVDIFTMGAVGGSMSLVHAVSSFTFGRLSDRIGRWRLIFVGALLTPACVIGCIRLEPNTLPYYASYCALGLGLGMMYPLLIAWLNQGHEADARSRGISSTIIRFALSWNAGLICGQLSGGWLYPLGLHWPMLLSLTLQLANLFLLLLLRGAPSRPGESPVPLKVLDDHQQALASAFAKISWVSIIGSSFCVSMILHLFPKLAVEMKVPSEQHGSILAIMRVTVIATYLTVHHLGFWQYRFWPILTAQGVAVCGLVLLVFAQGPIALAGGLAAVGLLVGHNYFCGLFYSSVSGGEHRRGFASGMHEAMLGLGFAAGSFGGGLVGTWYGNRAPYVLAICAITAMASIQIVYYFVRARPLCRIAAQED